MTKKKLIDEDTLVFEILKGKEGTFASLDPPLVKFNPHKKGRKPNKKNNSKK